MLFLNIMLGKKYLVKHSCINFYFKHKGNRICCVIQVIRMYQWSSKIWSACIFQALKTKHFFFFSTFLIDYIVVALLNYKLIWWKWKLLQWAHPILENMLWINFVCLLLGLFASFSKVQCFLKISKISGECALRIFFGKHSQKIVLKIFPSRVGRCEDEISKPFCNIRFRIS